MAERHDILIIGAGFAGLSCAARLRALGENDFVILERGEGCGGSWRGNYDRIRLHTPFHDLPDDGGIRRDYPQFMPRDDLVSYLERYAERHGLGPALRPHTEVTAIHRDGSDWVVDSDRGEFRAGILVVATAYNRKPLWPDIDGRERFTGTALHSRDYRNAEPYAGQRALVVGNGNSAAEIALDLADGGAASVSMLVRGPRHVLALRGLGFAARVARLLRIELTPDHIRAAHAYTRVHPEFRQKLAEKDKFFETFSVDMSAYGIERPESGPATQIALHGRVPWMDQGTVKAIRQGHIAVIDAKRNPVRHMTPNGVQFEAGEETFDLVVFATGMAPGLEDLFSQPDRYLEWNPDMARLMPRTDGRSRSTVESTLFFPGFDLSANGGLSLGLWGFECADAIHAEQLQGTLR